MKLRRQAHVIVTGVLFFMMTGCNMSSKPEQNEPVPEAAKAPASSIAKGVKDLGDASFEQFNLTDAQRAAGDTIIININGVIVRWHYDLALQSWIRSAKYTVGLDSLVCYDTVQFLDANNQGMKVPSLAATAKLKHTRSVQGSSLTVPYSYLYKMDVTLDKTAKDTFFVFNGTLKGTYNNETVNQTVVTNVTRKLERFPLTHLGYPVSGTIDITLPKYTVKVTFGGSDTVQVVITRLSDGKVWVINVNIDVSF